MSGQCGVDELLRLLQRAEVELHQPSIRRDVSRAGALLHDTFLEIGRSGTTYDRAATLEMMASEESTGQIVSQDFAVTALGEGAALLTYRSAIVHEPGKTHRHTLRTSIWIQTPDGWKLRFHQGTPTEAFQIADE